MSGIRSAVARTVDDNLAIPTEPTGGAVWSTSMINLKTDAVNEEPCRVTAHCVSPTSSRASDRQANTTNKNSARGIDTDDQDASELNRTAEMAVEETERAIEAFESTSEVVSGAIELWSPYIKLFLGMLGPVQYVMAAHYFVLILKTLGVLSSQDAQSRAWKEARISNAIFQDTADGYREVDSHDIVQNITKSSIVYDESNNTITSYFFYSMNNLVIQQLRGLNYFAYDSYSELLERVFVWNAFADAASKTAPYLSKFAKRRTVIYFLPCPRSNVLPHMEFTKIHQNVTIINHYQAKQYLTIGSVKVHEGCSIQIEHVTVCKIDATYGGKAHLHNCDVGWNQVPCPSSSPIPFLFGGKPDKFNNPYNVSGTVTCQECTTFDPKSKRGRDKRLKSIFTSPSNKFASCPSDTGIRSWSPTPYTIERTITNVSDATWCVIFKPDVGIVTRLKADPKNENEELESLTADPHGKELESFATMIPPLGGNVTVRITNTARSKWIQGTLIFIDSHGEEYSHKYKGRSNLTDFTIACPSIIGARRVVDAAACPVTSTTPQEAEDEHWQDEMNCEETYTVATAATASTTATACEVTGTQQGRQSAAAVVLSVTNPNTGVTIPVASPPPQQQQQQQQQQQVRQPAAAVVLRVTNPNTGVAIPLASSQQQQQTQQGSCNGR